MKDTKEYKVSVPAFHITYYSIARRTGNEIDPFPVPLLFWR